MVFVLRMVFGVLVWSVGISMVWKICFYSGLN